MSKGNDRWQQRARLRASGDDESYGSVLVADDPLPPSIAPPRSERKRAQPRPHWVPSDGTLIERIEAEVARNGTAVIYYLRRSDGLIKIGLTTDLLLRVKTLTRTYGPLELLTTEPGGRKVESKRHAQFRTSRLQALIPWEGDGCTEWFVPMPSVLCHIEMLKGP